MAKTTKYTRINPSGTYRIPDNEAAGFRIDDAPRGGYAMQAPFINRLGMYEDLFGTHQIENLNREQRDKLAALIKTL